jgi:hypothetical protein
LNGDTCRLTDGAADILDQIVRDGPLTAADIETATLRFKKALIERALGAELSHHLGYGPAEAKPELTTNHRNGTSGKTVLTDDGPVPIEVPRDREGTFEPQLIGKHERRLTGFDDKIIALYGRGLTAREIQASLKDMYAVDVSPDLIGRTAISTPKANPVAPKSHVRSTTTRTFSVTTTDDLSRVGHPLAVSMILHLQISCAANKAGKEFVSSFRLFRIVLTAGIEVRIGGCDRFYEIEVDCCHDFCGTCSVSLELGVRSLCLHRPYTFVQRSSCGIECLYYFFCSSPSHIAPSCLLRNTSRMRPLHYGNPGQPAEIRQRSRHLKKLLP